MLAAPSAPSVDDLDRSAVSPSRNRLMSDFYSEALSFATDFREKVLRRMQSLKSRDQPKSPVISEDTLSPAGYSRFIEPLSCTNAGDGAGAGSMICGARQKSTVEI